jgi:UDP-2,3-diacylglucosamine hydrolase
MERTQPAVFELCGKRFCMGHGDGLDPEDKGYKLLKWLFTNRFAQVMFSALHPRWAFGFGYSWSRHNRLAKGEQYQFRGECEPLVKFAREFQAARGEQEKIDYFVFGHYHYNSHYELPCKGELFIMGEWIHHYDYLVFDGESLKRFHLKNIE